MENESASNKPTNHTLLKKQAGKFSHMLPHEVNTQQQPRTWYVYNLTSSSLEIQGASNLYSHHRTPSMICSIFWEDICNLCLKLSH